jgi:hypothetical protein
MVEKRGLKTGPGQAEGVVSDEDALLIEEFCSLVAEIAARSLTRRHQEPDNDASSGIRR